MITYQIVILLPKAGVRPSVRELWYSRGLQAECDSEAF